jgi:hypothetical protein
MMQKTMKERSSTPRFHAQEQIRLHFTTRRQRDIPDSDIADGCQKVLIIPGHRTI